MRNMRKFAVIVVAVIAAAIGFLMVRQLAKAPSGEEMLPVKIGESPKPPEIPGFDEDDHLDEAINELEATE